LIDSRSRGSFRCVVNHAGVRICAERTENVENPVPFTLKPFGNGISVPEEAGSIALLKRLVELKLFHLDIGSQIAAADRSKEVDET
jgi:hypothetical protein